MSDQKDPRFIKGMPIVLKNVTAKWARIQADNPDTSFNDRKWTIDCYLSAAAADNLAGLGMNIKTDKETGERYYKATRTCVTAGGKKMPAPKVVALDGKTPVVEEVGNGSVVNVKLFVKYVEYNGKTTLKGYLDAVQVVDLVEYVADAGFDDLSGDGVGDDVPF